MMRWTTSGGNGLGAAFGATLAAVALCGVMTPLAAQAQNNSTDLATLRARADAEPNNPQALFGLAKTLADQGQVSQAIRLYQRILLIDPSLSRVHLNLGILLFLNGELEDARHHLSIALTEGRGSPAVQQRVQGYIDEIDARLNAHNVYGYVLTAGRFQSNPEAAPSSLLGPLDDNFIPGFDDAFTDDSGYGGVVAGDLTWIARLDKSGGAAFETHVQVYGSVQDQDDLNLFVGGFDLGPRFRLGSSYGAPSLRVYGFVNHANLGGESFFTGGGGGANFSVNFAEDVEGNLTYELEARGYDSDPVTVTVQEGAPPMPVQKTFFRDDTIEHRLNTELQIGVLGLDAVRLIGLGRIVEADTQDHQSLIEFGGGIDLQKSFRLSPGGNTWSISGGFLAKQRNYDEPDPIFNEDEEREQTFYRFSTTGSIPLADFAAILIGAGHTIVESNVQRFEYDNTEATAGVLFHF